MEVLSTNIRNSGEINTFLFKVLGARVWGWFFFGWLVDWLTFIRTRSILLKVSEVLSLLKLENFQGNLF